MRVDAEALGKAGEQAVIDGLEIGQGVAQDFAHGDDALRRRNRSRAWRAFPLGTLRHASIFAGIEVDQQRALIEDEVAVEEAAGAADLAAVDLDIVARPVARRHAELLQAERGGLADAPRHFGEIRQPERGAVEDQLPADLPLVEIEAAAAGDPAHGLDAVRRQ